MSATPRLFEFAVLWHPTTEQMKAGDKSQIIVDPQVVLAKDEATAAMLAGRAIPEDKLDEINQMEIAVRPF